MRHTPMRHSHRFPLATLALAGTLAAAANAAPETPEMAGQPLTVAEAVEVTLRRNAAVQQAAESVEERRGAFQAESGRFDTLFLADANFTFDARELIGARLEQEIERRLRLDAFAFALEETAKGIIEGFPPGAESILFQDCTDQQTRIVINQPNGSPIVLCRNFDGEITGIVVRDGDFDSQELQDLLDLRDELGDDIEQAFLDRLRAIARLLRLISNSLALQRARLGDVPDEIESLELDVLFAYQVRFRNGLAVTPMLTLNSTEENFAGKPRTPSFGDSTVPNLFRTSAGIDLEVPLGKGRGTIATAGPERAAEADLRSAEQLLVHTASERALATVNAYWAVAAAQQRLRRLEESAAIQADIRDKTSDLVEADEITRSELARVEARYADVRAQVAGARQEMVFARLDLVTQMGVSAGLMEHTPRAAEGLPDGFGDLDGPEAWVRDALEQRHDLLAAAEITHSSDLLAQTARANLRHQVDLAFNLSYNGLYESFEERLFEPDGFLKAWEGQIAGPSFGLGLRWVVPFANNAARGRLVRAQALRSQSEIRESDLERRIRLRILGVFGELVEARLELESLRLTQDAQEEALEASRELFEAGESTLIDTLLTEEQLTDARLALVDATRRIAELEAELQFESGRLLEDTGGADRGDPTRLRLALITPPGDGG